MKKHFPAKRVLLILIPVIALAALIAFLFFQNRQGKIHELLKTSEYNCVFLSMFPIDTFQEEYFSRYRAQDALILRNVIPNYKTLKSYLRDVALSENEVTTIYLGVDPKKITAEQILGLHESFPDCTFEVIPVYRRLSQWMKDWQVGKTYDAYLTMTTKLMGQENIRVYSFFAQEWLIADDTNYSSGVLLTEPLAERIYIYSDNLHHCDFKPEEVATIFDAFNLLLSETKENGYKFPDLSSWDVLCLGDSVFGNYAGHDSIPELISYLSGARSYNCGWSGATASGSDPSSGTCILRAYLTQDLSALPDNVQARTGLEKRLKDEATSSSRKLLFALHYCLNEYFYDKPLDNASDPLDENTYCGAMRSMIETIQKERPDAKILLIAPNSVTIYKAGSVPMGENGALLNDYADALLGVGAEYGIPVLDGRGVITSDEAARFLDGDVHPNEFGRYKIAKAIIRCISEMEP